MSTKPNTFLISMAIALVVLAGCQTPHDTTASAPPAPSASMRALVVSGGNAGNIAVFVPSSDPANPMMFSTTGAKECPECKAAALKYFQTGVLDPVCSKTGATRTPLYGPGTVGMHYGN